MQLWPVFESPVHLSSPSEFQLNNVNCFPELLQPHPLFINKIPLMSSSLLSHLPHFLCWTATQLLNVHGCSERDSWFRKLYLMAMDLPHTEGLLIPPPDLTTSSPLKLTPPPSLCTNPPLPLCLLLFEQMSLPSDSPLYVHPSQHSVLASPFTRIWDIYTTAQPPRLLPFTVSLPQIWRTHCGHSHFNISKTNGKKENTA